MRQSVGLTSVGVPGVDRNSLQTVCGEPHVDDVGLGGAGGGGDDPYGLCQNTQSVSTMLDTSVFLNAFKGLKKTQNRVSVQVLTRVTLMTQENILLYTEMMKFSI